MLNNTDANQKNKAKPLDSPRHLQYDTPIHKTPAEVVKLVDTQRSGRCARRGMGVRVPPSAPMASQAACEAT
jgi:hypothetical protein